MNFRSKIDAADLGRVVRRSLYKSFAFPINCISESDLCGFRIKQYVLSQSGACQGQIMDKS